MHSLHWNLSESIHKYPLFSCAIINSMISFALQTKSNAIDLCARKKHLILSVKSCDLCASVLLYDCTRFVRRIIRRLQLFSSVVSSIVAVHCTMCSVSVENVTRIQIVKLSTITWALAFTSYGMFPTSIFNRDLFMFTCLKTIHKWRGMCGHEWNCISYGDRDEEEKKN